MVRIERDRDVPHHFEAAPLKAPVNTVGWILGVLAVAAGIACYVRAELVAAEAAAMVLTATGGTVLVLLVRCRRYEVMVGKRMVELRLGPFRRMFPTGCVDAATPRRATAWRRLYAASEVVLFSSVATRPFIVPTDDPDVLRSALLGNR